MIGIIGGPNLTPQNSTKFERISGVMLSTYLLTWKMSRRYMSTGKDRLTDDSELILCNLAVKKDYSQNLALNLKDCSIIMKKIFFWSN
jgi:hypothetical protein